MEAFSALLVFCAVTTPITGELKQWYDKFYTHLFASLATEVYTFWIYIVVVVDFDFKLNKLTSMDKCLIAN